MVRRGSAVRVRQRALQKPRKSRLFRSKQLARLPLCDGYGVVYGAFRARTPLLPAVPGGRERAIEVPVSAPPSMSRCGSEARCHRPRISGRVANIASACSSEVPIDDTYPASIRATAPTSTASSTTSIAVPSVSPVTPASQRRKPKPSSSRKLAAHAARIAASAALTTHAMARASPAASAARPCPPRVSELPVPESTRA